MNDPLDTHLRRTGASIAEGDADAMGDLGSAVARSERRTRQQRAAIVLGAFLMVGLVGGAAIARGTGTQENGFATSPGDTSITTSPAPGSSVPEDGRRCSAARPCTLPSSIGVDEEGTTSTTETTPNLSTGTTLQSTTGITAPTTSSSSTSTSTSTTKVGTPTTHPNGSVVGVELEANGIGPRTLGSGGADTLAYLTSKLGSPIESVQHDQPCPWVQHRWGDLTVDIVNSGANGPVFAGYHYDVQNGGRPESPRLASPNGITIGVTMPRAQLEAAIKDEFAGIAITDDQDSPSATGKLGNFELHLSPSLDGSGYLVTSMHVTGGLDCF